MNATREIFTKVAQYKAIMEHGVAMVSQIWFFLQKGNKEVLSEENCSNRDTMTSKIYIE